MFLEKYGMNKTSERYIRTDQGGKLARSKAFRKMSQKYGIVLKQLEQTILHKMEEANGPTAPMETWFDAYCTAAGLVLNSGATRSYTLATSERSF